MYLLCVWLACLLAYLGSEKQQVLDKPLNKLSAWIGFLLLNAMACYQLVNQYAELSACVMLLVLVSLMWIIIVLSAPHVKTKGWRYCMAGSAIFAALAALVQVNLVPLGVSYVA